MTIEISSNSFLEVADQVEAQKKNGYTKKYPITLDEEANLYKVTLTKSEDEQVAEDVIAEEASVALEKPKRGPKKAAPVADEA